MKIVEPNVWMFGRNTEKIGSKVNAVANNWTSFLSHACHLDVVAEKSEKLKKT